MPAPRKGRIQMTVPRLDLARGEHAGNLEGANGKALPSVDKWNAGLRDGASRSAAHWCRTAPA